MVPSGHARTNGQSPTAYQQCRPSSPPPTAGPGVTGEGAPSGPASTAGPTSTAGPASTAGDGSEDEEDEPISGTAGVGSADQDEAISSDEADTD